MERVRHVISAAHGWDTDRAYSVFASAAPVSLYGSVDQGESDETDGENFAEDDKTIKAKPATTRTNRLTKKGPRTKKRETGDGYIAGSVFYQSSRVIHARAS